MRIFVTAVAIAGALSFIGGTASAASSSYCKNQATAYANKVASPTGGGVVGGVVGGTVGALIGNAFGNSSGETAGAAIAGGAVGAAAGNAGEKKKWQNAYNAEYARCMAS